MWNIIGEIAGGLGGNALKYQQGKQKESTQRHWLEKMSGSAHQREVADLRKAGLNPILSALKSGASSPGYQQSPPPEYGKSVTSALSVARQGQLTRAQIREASARARQSEVDAEIAEMALSKLKGDKTHQGAVTTGWLSRKANIRGEVGVAGSALNSARKVYLDWLDKALGQSQETHYKNLNKKPKPKPKSKSKPKRWPGMGTLKK